MIMMLKLVFYFKKVDSKMETIDLNFNIGSLF